MSDLLLTGTVTLLLADVVTDTADAARSCAVRPGDRAAASERLDRTLADLVAAYGGVRPAEQCQGDGFVAAFARASDAVACAMALQRAPLAPIQLRIAVHTGEVQPARNGGYAGPVMNHAALLCGVAHGGQILLSRATGGLAADRLPPNAWLADLGSHRLSGLPYPERVTQLCHPDLVNDFPPLRTTKAGAGRHFPAPLTSFVGREAELAGLLRLVRDNRLVTLTGAGGVGKTRLALQLSAELADRFGDGAWCADLASITDPGLVAVRVTHALGLSDQPGGSAVDTLARFIGERELLLLLDNCEHVLDACAELVSVLLGACPALTVLTTSRKAIGVPGEVTWLTPSLSPADEAVELFTQRARLVRPDFAATGDDGAAVAEICRRLDGLPLAIELAATRVRALSLSEILDGLRDRFRLLTGGSRTVVARQQTLRASVDWSHALLSESERIVFRRLGVFLGGFDVDAADAVAGDDDVPRHQIVDELASLVDKSLLVADNVSDRTRYRMLETLRQYALEKLDEAGEADTARTRHRDHYTTLFGTTASAGHQERIRQADIEIDNLRAASAWSRQHGDGELAAQLASSLQPLWIQSRILEGLAWFEAVLTDSGPLAPAARALALADKTILETLTGAYYLVDQGEQAIAIARELGDPALLAWALAVCGFTCCYSPEIALPYFREAVELAPAIRGDDWRLSQIFATHAYVAFVAGDPAAVRPAAEEGRRLADAIGDGSVSRQCRWCIGLAQWMTGQLTEAAAQFREVAAEAQAARDPMFSACALFLLGMTLAHRGDTSAARAAAEASIEAAADLAAFQRGAGFGALVDALLADGDVPAALAASDAACAACPLPQLLATNGNPVAKAALASGDVAAARRWADEALSAASGGHRMILLATRVRVAIAAGEVEQAERDAHDALAIAAKVKAYLTIPDVIECLAVLSADSGGYAEAARMFGAAEAIRAHTGQVRFKVYDADYIAAVDELRDSVKQKDLDAWWAEGAALSPAEAVAYAHRGRGERKRAASGWASLTATEREVARLVGEGLGNKDVAARLFISSRTVQTHLTHIYSKLEVSSRVQLARETARQI